MSLPPQVIIALVGVFLAVPPALAILWKLAHHWRGPATGQSPQTRSPASIMMRDAPESGQRTGDEGAGNETGQVTERAMEEGRLSHGATKTR